MPYEIWWALAVLIWIFGSIGLAILRAHLRSRHRLRVREMVHAERMAALEREIAPIELPDLEAELAALEDTRGTRPVARPMLVGGILLLSLGLGTIAAFYLSSEQNLFDIWPLGLIGVMVGVGLLATDRLAPRDPLD